MQNDQSGPTAAPDVNGQSFDAKFTDLVIRLTVVGFFAYLSLTLLAPFAIMVIWAVILAVALYPAFAALRRLLGGRGGLAATLITLLGLVDHRRPARGGHGQRRRNHAGAGRRLREPDGGRAAAARVGAGVAGDRRKGPCGLEPRLRQSRSRGEAVRASPAAGGRRDRRQDRGGRLRHARICRVGADRRLSLRPGPAAGRGHQDLRPPHRGRARGALRRPGRSDDPQHLARGDRRRLASGASHRSHPDACSVSRRPA